MPGRELTSLDVNNRAAAVVEQLWSALEEASKLYRWLSDANITGASDANLIAAGLTTEDITAIRAAATDLGGPSGLWGVAHAQSHPSGNNDFFFNAKLLAGINFTG